MKIIHSETHREHDPPFEFTGDRLTPYSERPARAEAILRTLQERDFADVIAPGDGGLEFVREVHDADYLDYLAHAYEAWRESGKAETGVLPDTFAVRGMRTRPGERRHRDGYYCFDAQTPIVSGTYRAALASARCALTGASLLLFGERAVYALCRPPGHHAGRDLYGGYCYLNNAAVAAACLGREGRVAVLDVDYHHGNGTQDIFYESGRVLVVSIHGDPDRAYPYFSGFAEERGAGAGEGFNRNFPLREGVEETEYLAVLAEGLGVVGGFSPRFLVVSTGVDTFRDDPLGDFNLSVDAFARVGARIAGAGLPTLFVQEGGYQVQEMGTCVANLLEGYERG